MAALVATGAILSGCSKKEVEEPEIRNNPDITDNIVTVTTTINLDENDATKALAIDYDAKTLTKTFAVGDKIAVIYHNKSGNLDKAESVALTESDLFGGGKSAKITVTLTNPKAYESVKYIYPASMAGTDDVDYSKLKNQTGTLAGIAASLDLATFEGSLDGWYRLPSSVKLENEFAIIAYTLKDETGANDITGTITGMTINDGTNGYTISGRDSDGRIYAAIRPTSHAGIGYFATNGTKNYNKSVTDKTYEAGQFYQLGLRMAEAPVTDLSTISANYTVSNGETITGTLAGSYEISIAKGATVTLKDVNISVSNNELQNNWPGITCLGDATIFLSGKNIVRVWRAGWPGILAGPTGTTLTISGTGSLDVSSNSGGAGIGSGTARCGDIIISGGTITAKGGLGAPGIGSGRLNSCGNITICGGTITAKGGGSGVGIGSGWSGSCGNITITDGVTSVTAIKGENSVNCIGAGDDGSCGTVTIGGVVRGNISESPYFYPEPTRLSTLSSDYTAADGETLYGTLAGNYKISIAAGATVTLKDVTIDGSGNYAGINCMGDATIILDGTNNVKGYSSDYPGIYVPRYKTLTILGTGSLTAIGNGCGAGIGGSSNAYCGNIVIEGGTITATAGEYAAGIGGGGFGDCGNITISGGTVTAISGGTVTATGGDKAAGIGSGSTGSCGSITISGGTVTATGGDEAAGIGTGSYGSCGNITINEGVTSVTATKGFDAYNSIGAGYHGSCGTVTIGGNVGTISKSPYTFPVITDLSTVDGNYTALNLETLTGTLAGNYMISIAAGATVTLKDMTIGGTDNSDYQWAGITCEGNATIILEGTNSVEGSSYYYPGIHVPKGSTLTIRGTGSLTSIGQGGGSGIGGTGVSDGRSYCGNIKIEGGIITATAGEYAAGIGGGKNCNCGNITITGGTVTAYGGTKSAGIGSSMGSDCGNIRITDGVTKVTVYSGAIYAIGPGDNGSCGSVRIGGNSGGVAGSPYIYQP